MTRFKTIAFALLSMFVISACGDDTPTEPSTPNGYVANGDGYSSVEVTSSSQIAVMTSTTSTITMTGTLGGENAIMSIVINGNTPQEYTWLGNGSVAVVLTVGTGSNAKVYTGTSGKTVVTSVGSSGGKVVGTFQGTVVNNADATRKIEINGKFNATIS